MSNPLDPQSGYKVPKGNSPYLTFEEGDTEFLPVASAVVGYEYWTNEKKPVRLHEEPVNPAALPNIRPDIVEKDGQERTIYKVHHFWAFPVIDCEDGKVKLLKITQQRVQKAIAAYVKNKRWGSPVFSYTITVNRTGSGFDTEYSTMANPTNEIPEAYRIAWENAQAQGFSVERWFDGGEVYGNEVEGANAPGNETVSEEA